MTIRLYTSIATVIQGLPIDLRCSSSTRVMSASVWSICTQASGWSAFGKWPGVGWNFARASSLCPCRLSRMDSGTWLMRARMVESLGSLIPARWQRPWTSWIVFSTVGRFVER